MNLSGPFIRRPVMTTLVMAAILVFGIMSYKQLPVSDLPNVDFPTIYVSANLPGASAETMASTVATPLEKQFSGISGIDSMTSTSSQGSTRITLQFTLDRDIDAAAQDVQSAIARTTHQLPPSMPSPPSYRKQNPADMPILFYVLSSDTLPLSEVTEYGETMIGQRLSMVDGVSQVQVWGSQKYAVRVQIDPQQMVSRGIGFDEVAQALDAGNVNLPTGIIDGPHKTMTIRVDGQLMNAESYRPLIVAYRNGAPVRLGELGRVIDSVENYRSAAWYYDPTITQRSIMLAVNRQPGTNTVKVADAVKALIPSFREKLPASITLRMMYDRSADIRDSAGDMQWTLLLALCLVVLVIFLFLRNVSATVIPSMALPMSVVGTFVVMYFMGYNLDNLSLMSLTLAIGFVVDDAIVMLENIVRHSEMGKDRMTAAQEGSKQVSFTILSMTLSLSAVFIPVLFMGGIVGRLFREFAVTIGTAVLMSGFFSLTLMPMLTSRFLRPPSSIRHGHIYAVSERMFKGVLNFYGRTLSATLRHPLATLLLSIGVVVATGLLFYVMPKGFLPPEDGGIINARTEAAEGTSYKSMFEYQQAVATAVRQNPDIKYFMSMAGGGPGGGASNTGNMFLLLKDRPERKLTTDEVIQRLRSSVAKVPGINVFFTNPPAIPIGGRSTTGQYQFTLQGSDTDELYLQADRLKQEISKLDGFQDVGTDVRLKNPELDITIDRDAASSLGLTVGQIEQALFNAYGSPLASTIYAPNNDYQVIMELLPEYQSNAAALSWLYVRSNTGRIVPLYAVASVKEDFGPLSINHSGQMPSATVSFNLKPGTALSEAVARVNEVAQKTLPASISTGFQGTAQAFQSSVAGMWLLLLLAVAVIYIVLGILYENFFHPITIFSSLPFAGFGALVTLMVFGQELSLYAFVGIIMLIGLVKKNGIMMIDFALEAQRTENKTPIDAIHEACMVRFRPIMMTTVCAIMAGLPIAIGVGAGGLARRPLGMAVVGGLLFSQTLTLFVTPVIYLYIEALQRLLRKWFGSKSAEADVSV